MNPFAPPTGLAPPAAVSPEPQASAAARSDLAGATARPNSDLPATPLSRLDWALALALQQAQPSPDPRHIWLAALVSQAYALGHACLDVSGPQADWLTELGWSAQAARTVPADLAQAAHNLVWTQGDDSPLVWQAPRLYLRRNAEAEAHIASAWASRLHPDPVLPAPERVRTALDALFARPPADAPVVASLGSRLDSMTPPPADSSPGVPAVPPGPQPPASPDWQRVACALALRAPLVCIAGGPGTGKTTTVTRLLALLVQLLARADASPIKLALAAPTGKAAARLTEALARAAQTLPAGWSLPAWAPAQTLHKLLRVRPDQPLATQPALLDCDVLVVDEASMIDLALLARLARATPAQTRVILLGDPDQLASVEAGAAWAQLCAQASQAGYSRANADWLSLASGQDVHAWVGGAAQADDRADDSEGAGPLAQQTVMLRHSHRFAAGGAIGRWAQAVNTADQPALGALWRAAQAGAGAVDAIPLKPGELAVRVRTGWAALHARLQQQRCFDDAQAAQALQDWARFALLTPLREGPWGVAALNRLCARALGLTVGDAWQAGRPVMVRQNDAALGLMNGDVGLCLPTAQGLRVAFADAAGAAAGVRWLRPGRLAAVETVWAMTVHKAQGSEAAHVMLVWPGLESALFSRELLYTAITRARDRLTLVADSVQPWVQAAQRPTRRWGALGERLAAQALV